MRRLPDDGRRRRLNDQKRLLNKKDRLGIVAVRGAGVVGQVSVAVSVRRYGPWSTETVATPCEARPGSASALGAGIVWYSQSKERKQAEQDRSPHGKPS
jgi:threonine dehydrogenase-like Zn-dependent dehydrogenase